MEFILYRCEICGKIIAVIRNSPAPTICCGQKMTLLEAGTTDASVEKHVPVVDVKDDIVFVKVGEEVHPMNPNHYIQWILLETEDGIQIKNLQADEKPSTCFVIRIGEKVKVVYAYCNIHGLWKCEVNS